MTSLSFVQGLLTGMRRNGFGWRGRRRDSKNVEKGLISRQILGYFSSISPPPPQACHGFRENTAHSTTTFPSFF